MFFCPLAEHISYSVMMIVNMYVTSFLYCDFIYICYSIRNSPLILNGYIFVARTNCCFAPPPSRFSLRKIIRILHLLVESGSVRLLYLIILLVDYHSNKAFLFLLMLQPPSGSYKKFKFD